VCINSAAQTAAEQEIQRPKHEVGWERVTIPPNLSFPTDS